MIHENFVFLAVAINVVGASSYILDTLRGKTRPNRVTWTLWALAPLVGFAGELSEGVGVRAWFTFSIGAVPLSILIASFFAKSGVWELKRRDYILGAIALMGIVLWRITDDALLAIIFAVIADFLAGLPTIIKSYTHPETESSFTFLVGIFAGMITILTIDAFTFANAAFPFLATGVSAIIYFFLESKIGVKTKS